MPLDIVVGAQWGDEGKGRIVDYLAIDADYVARFNGGDNAGHTVTVGEETFKLHLIPSGIIHPNPVSVVGNGVVVNPKTIIQEIQYLKDAGIEVTPERLRISYAAHMITPVHLAIDKAQEKSRGRNKIGTTLRGIGPAYTDKVSRVGLRLESLLKPETFASAFMQHVENGNRLLTGVYQSEPLDSAAITKEYLEYAHQLIPYITDTSRIIHDALRTGLSVLAEGAQGTLLDLDHGTYPFVTSSNPTASGALTGLGIGPTFTRRIIGVTKVFQTRVGAGPFPTEVLGDTAIQLRGTGEKPWDEFGVTTGRPRRVGWLDVVLLRYSSRVNGLTELVLTKLDILSELPSVKLCVGYRSGAGLSDELPAGPTDLSPYQPVYEDFPGWNQDIRHIITWEQLPPGAKAYVERIQTLVGVPVRSISVGPERDQIIHKF